MAIKYEKNPKKYVEQYKKASKKFNPNKIKPNNIKVLFIAESHV